MVTPAHTNTMPTPAVPATFAGAEISRMSSMNPIAQIAIAAIATPSISELPSNSGPNLSICHAKSNAVIMPTSSATPPMSGVGVVCTLRGSGWAIQFFRRAKLMTNGVTAKVTMAAHAATMR